MRSLGILLTVAVLGLTGCKANEYRPGVKDVVVISPPAHLLTDCELPAPPDKNLYSQAVWAEKERLWTEAMMEFYRSGRNCNVKMYTIRQWVEQHKDVQRDARPGNSRTGGR